MTAAIQIQTTLPSKDEAQRIATELVQHRLAACVQVTGPIRSTYWWQGQIESGEEWLCTAKTRRDRYDVCEAAIRELHPYQTPEIIAVPIVAGSEAYLHWIDEELAPR